MSRVIQLIRRPKVLYLCFHEILSFCMLFELGLEILFHPMVFIWLFFSSIAYDDSQNFMSHFKLTILFIMSETFVVHCLIHSLEYLFLNKMSITMTFSTRQSTLLVCFRFKVLRYKNLVIQTQLILRITFWFQSSFNDFFHKK